MSLRCTFQEIKEVTERLIKSDGPERIALFGSYAIGRTEEESNIDLLIVKETPKRPIGRRAEVERISLNSFCS